MSGNQDGIPSKMSCRSLSIGTHDGTFHCDEVLSCFLLRSLETYKDAEIIRSRDPATLGSCTIVVDVGGVYNSENHRYDHHQRGFDETMQSLCADKPWVTKLSSAGLVYVHFGRQALSALLGIDVKNPDMETLYDAMYQGFVEEIDAVDNGINQYEGIARYKVTSTIGSRVANLNPAWNSMGLDQMVQFTKAMEMVGAEFVRKARYIFDSWIPARTVVANAIDNRLQVDSSGQIVRFGQFCPWKSHLFDIEEMKQVSPTIKFVLFDDQKGNWRVQCVPIGESSFQNRVSLKEEWRGIRDDALSTISGIPGCIFVHASGFIGGNQSYDGALAMARSSLGFTNEQ